MGQTATQEQRTPWAPSHTRPDRTVRQLMDPVRRVVVGQSLQTERQLCDTQWVLRINSSPLKVVIISFPFQNNTGNTVHVSCKIKNS